MGELKNFCELIELQKAAKRLKFPVKFELKFNVDIRFFRLLHLQSLNIWFIHVELVKGSFNYEALNQCPEETNLSTPTFLEELKNDEKKIENFKTESLNTPLRLSLKVKTMIISCQDSKI